MTISLFALVTCMPCVSCSGKERTKIDNDLVGKWEDQVKLVGGQGMAILRIHFTEDRKFTMNVEVGERAHFLNAYPTQDRIRLQGLWSVQHDGRIILDGKIEEFSRTIVTGKAASQGFLPDDKAEKIETHYTPLPFEYPMMLTKSDNDSLYLGNIKFRGNKPGSELLDPTSRMITAVKFKKTSNDSDD